MTLGNMREVGVLVVRSKVLAASSHLGICFRALPLPLARRPLHSGFIPRSDHRRIGQLNSCPLPAG